MFNFKYFTPNEVCFGKDIVDRTIKCVEEINAIRSGKKFLKTKDYKWEA